MRLLITIGLGLFIALSGCDDQQNKTRQRAHTSVFENGLPSIQQGSQTPEVPSATESVVPSFPSEAVAQTPTQENNQSQNEETSANVSSPDTSANEETDESKEDNNASNVPPVEKQTIDNTPAKEWYVRIVVEDTTRHMKCSDAQLGQLAETNATQKHALKAIAPFDASYLDVVFVNPPGVAEGEYKSDFRSSENKTAIWEFEVKSSDTHADMILSWRGLFVVTPYKDAQGRIRYREYRSLTNPLLKRMVLHDVDEGGDVAVKEGNDTVEYTFNMNGKHSRKFQWILKETSIDSRSVNRAKSIRKTYVQHLRAKAMRADMRVNRATIEEKKRKTLELIRPPEFKLLVKER